MGRSTLLLLNFTVLNTTTTSVATVEADVAVSFQGLWFSQLGYNLTAA